MSDANLDLRPMGMAEILDRAFALYRRNFSTFFGVILIVQILVFILSLPLSLYAPQMAGSAGMDPAKAIAFAGLSMLWMVAWIIVAFVGGGVLTLAVSERYMGRALSVGDAYRKAAPRLWTLVAVALLLVLLAGAAIAAFSIAVGIGAVGLSAAVRGNAVAVGLVVGLVVAIAVIAVLWFLFYLYLTFLLTGAVVMVEGAGPIAALARSRELMRRKTEKGFFSLRSNAAKATVILLVALAVNIAVSLLVGIPAFIVNLAYTHGSVFAGAVPVLPWYVLVIEGAASAIARAAVSPIYTIPIVLFYYDIRTRFEAFDLAMLAQSLPGSTPAATAAENA
jgi:hypothetical protein